MNTSKQLVISFLYIFACSICRFCMASTIIPHTEGEITPVLNDSCCYNNINVEDFSVDSIKISLFGDYIDISATFVESSNTVVLKYRNNTIVSEFNSHEHNTILNAIDSLYISKIASPVIRNFRIPEFKMSKEAPLLTVCIFTRENKITYIEQTSVFNFDTAYIFSEYFYNVFKILYNKYQLNKIPERKVDNLIIGSPTKSLIIYLEKLYAPNPIPDYILNKIND